MHKRVFVTVCVLLFYCNAIQAQRYMENVFSAVDSVVNITFGKANDYLHQTQQLLFDLYQPHNDTVKTRPLLVYVHGGGFTGGTRKWPSIKLLCEKMALKGYVVASIDYRLDPTFNVFDSTADKRAITDAMHDLKAAIRFFKLQQATYGIDTGKIFVGGESAGAITAMMATYMNKTRELIAFNKTTPATVEGNSGNAGADSKPSAALCLCGYGDTLAMENSSNPPFLWIHGSSDPLVSIAHASQLLTRAEHIGLIHEAYIFKSATHCPWYYGLPGWESYLDSTVEMIAKFLYPYTKRTVLLNRKDFNDWVYLSVQPAAVNLVVDRKLVSSRKGKQAA